MKEKNSIRLNKYLAMSGVCSRRDADKLIEEGRVSVNGSIAAVGISVFPQDEVRFNGRIVKNDNSKVVLAYNKPKGVTCTEKDRFADKKITDMIDYPIRVTYAGRLDKDSEGLILLTNDGDLINGLMKGSAGHEKEYSVKIDKEITEDFIKKMSNGIYLKELDITTKPCVVKKTGKYTFNIILTEGVNRQIRRMCKTLNCYVTHLKRVRIANILLANLKIGEYREISGIELQTLYNEIHNN
ncbi:MAG: pseudouridine synthase [Lachnospiraceae bacterium]|nr:pseudouridine synthase [Lachnospiraceae bacterium]